LNDGRIQNPSKPFWIVPLANFVPRGFGFVHHSIAILDHEVPNPYLTIRNLLIAVRRRWAAWARARPGWGSPAASRSISRRRRVSAQACALGVPSHRSSFQGSSTRLKKEGARPGLPNRLALFLSRSALLYWHDAVPRSTLLSVCAGGKSSEEGDGKLAGGKSAGAKKTKKPASAKGATPVKSPAIAKSTRQSRGAAKHATPANTTRQERGPKAPAKTGKPSSKSPAAKKARR
jgi:hypothetical protein